MLSPSWLLTRALKLANFRSCPRSRADFPALSTVLAILFLGEKVSAPRALGVALTIVGIVIVTRRNNSEETKSPNKSKMDKLGIGLGYAITAFLAYGFLYFALKIVVASSGPIIPVLVQRLTTVFALTILFSISKPTAVGNFKSWSLLYAASCHWFAGCVGGLGVQFWRAWR